MRPLDELIRSKAHFGPGAPRRVGRLLETLRDTRLRRPADLLALHEAALFFRAYPHNARVLHLADSVLANFGERLAGIDHSAFEDPDVSGIAGTSVSTNCSYEFARTLVSRYGRHIAIDWENYQHPERLGAILARLLPGAAEDFSVEPHVDWRAWWDSARLELPWL